MTTALGEDACSKVKFLPKKDGDDVKEFTTCVPKGKCVNPARPEASFADEAYCRAKATGTCQKGHCENYGSTCYAHADSDNKGLTPKMTPTGNQCDLWKGRVAIKGDECKVEIKVAAVGGYLGCKCECDQRVEIPKGAERGPDGTQGK